MDDDSPGWRDCEWRFGGPKILLKKIGGAKSPKNDLNTSYLGSSLQLTPKTVRNRLKNHPKWPESFHSSHGKTSPMTDRYTAVFNHDYGRKSILAKNDRQGFSGSSSWKRYTKVTGSYPQCIFQSHKSTNPGAISFTWFCWEHFHMFCTCWGL